MSKSTPAVKRRRISGNVANTAARTQPLLQSEQETGSKTVGPELEELRTALETRRQRKRPRGPWDDVRCICDDDCGGNESPPLHKASRNVAPGNASAKATNDDPRVGAGAGADSVARRSEDPEPQNRANTADRDAGGSGSAGGADAGVSGGGSGDGTALAACAGSRSSPGALQFVSRPARAALLVLPLTPSLDVIGLRKDHVEALSPQLAADLDADPRVTIDLQLLTSTPYGQSGPSSSAAAAEKPAAITATLRLIQQPSGSSVVRWQLEGLGPWLRERGARREDFVCLAQRCGSDDGGSDGHESRSAPLHVSLLRSLLGSALLKQQQQLATPQGQHLRAVPQRLTAAADCDSLQQGGSQVVEPWENGTRWLTVTKGLLKSGALSVSNSDAVSLFIRNVRTVDIKQGVPLRLYDMQTCRPLARVMLKKHASSPSYVLTAFRTWLHARTARVGDVVTLHRVVGDSGTGDHGGTGRGGGDEAVVYLAWITPNPAAAPETATAATMPDAATGSGGELGWGAAAPPEWLLPGAGDADEGDSRRELDWHVSGRKLLTVSEVRSGVMLVTAGLLDGVFWELSQQVLYARKVTLICSADDDSSRTADDNSSSSSGDDNSSSSADDDSSSSSADDNSSSSGDYDSSSRGGDGGANVFQVEMECCGFIGCPIYFMKRMAPVYDFLDAKAGDTLVFRRQASASGNSGGGGTDFSFEIRIVRRVAGWDEESATRQRRRQRPVLPYIAGAAAATALGDTCSPHPALHL